MGYVCLLMGAGILAGCAAGNDDRDQQHRFGGLAIASVAIAEALREASDHPQPAPDPGGDKPDKPELSSDRLRVFTRNDCPPCEKWRRESLPVLEKRGWVVGETIEIVKTAGRTTPTFEWIDEGEVETRWVGYRDQNRFMAILKRAMNRR